MPLTDALKSQYHASLKTLRLAIEKCPDSKWSEAGDGFAAFWRVAYHTLFFTHLYLQPKFEDFKPWEHHQNEANSISPKDWEGKAIPNTAKPYSREQVLTYWTLVDGMIDAGVDALDLNSPDSGFPWYRMSKLEHQLVNLRHIQHHASALSTRLRREAGIEIGWVGKP